MRLTGDSGLQSRSHAYGFYALLNPNLRQEILLKPCLIPVDNPEQAREDPAARSRIVKINERASALARRDCVSSARDDNRRGNLPRARHDRLHLKCPHEEPELQTRYLLEDSYYCARLDAAEQRCEFAG